MIDSSSITLFLCASLGPGAFCCFLQRHILHSFMCEDLPSVLWFQHPFSPKDTTPEIVRSGFLRLFASSTSICVASCSTLQRSPALCWILSSSLCRLAALGNTFLLKAAHVCCGTCCSFLSRRTYKLQLDIPGLWSSPRLWSSRRSREEAALDSHRGKIRQRPHVRSVCDPFCPALKTLQVEL